MKTILLLFWVSLLNSSFLYAKARVENLADHTNLRDDHDDSQGLLNAIRAAGNGGAVIIPAKGRCVITEVVEVNAKNISIIGQTAMGSVLQFRGGGGLIFANDQGGARYSMRNLRIKDHSSSQEGALIDFTSRSIFNSRLTMDNISMVRLRGATESVIAVNNFDEIKINKVDFNGRFRRGTAFSFLNNGRSLSFTNVSIEKFERGIDFVSAPDFSTVTGLSIESTNIGISMNSSGKSPVLQVYSADFLSCAHPIQITESAKIVIIKSYFGQRNNGAENLLLNDIELDNPNIEGTIFDNYFDRGVYCKRINKLTITGNAFKAGFRYALNEPQAFIAVGNKNQLQAEGNLYIDDIDGEVMITTTEGDVFLDSLEDFN